jgi:hypothetical protein
VVNIYNLLKKQIEEIIANAKILYSIKDFQTDFELSKPFKNRVQGIVGEMIGLEHTLTSLNQLQMI